MNPIGILCTAVASGCAAGLVSLLWNRSVARDADILHFAELDEKTLAGSKVVAKVIDQRAKARAERTDRLRLEYLAATGQTAE